MDDILRQNNELGTKLMTLGITDGLEETHFLAQRLGTLGSHGSFDIHLFQQAGVLGDSHHVTHLVTVTPVQHAVTAEATVTAEDDLHLRPGLAEPLHQQGQNGPGMSGAILAGGVVSCEKR